MSEAAGTRSLEDILASIRQSLADENVDGLVKLSAAAAAAARAEVGEEAKLQSDLATALALPEASEDDPLKDKLMGALGGGERAADDLGDLITTPAPASAAGEGEEEPAPMDAAALAKLWFLRPGAAEETAAAAEGPAPELRIDPFADRAAAEPAGVTTAAALFALSARAIVGDSPAPQGPAPAAPSSPSAEAAKPQAPRLDASQIEMINKLKASSAAAVESIATDDDIVDLRTPAWPPKPAPQPAAPLAQAKPEPIEPAVPAARAEPVLPAAKPEAAPPVAAAEVTKSEPAKVEAPAKFAVEDDPAVLPASLLTLPARSTPLFVSANERSRPIVSAPPLASSSATLLADSGDDEPVQPKREMPLAVAVEAPIVEVPVVESTVVEAELHDPDLDDVLAPVAEPEQPERPSRLTDALDQLAEVEDADEQPNIHTLKTVAVPVSPSPEAPEHATGGEEVASPPLEQMIAAVLEPVMHRLLEHNLGPMIEAMVRREVEKALEARRDT